MVALAATLLLACRFLKLKVVVNMVVVVAQWAASLGLQRLVVIDICWPTGPFFCCCGRVFSAKIPSPCALFGAIL